MIRVKSYCKEHALRDANIPSFADCADLGGLFHVIDSRGKYRGRMKTYVQ